ncbi:MAG: SRPBCC family protein [Actinomycetota bacterium]|nr:SRPBCC family protein [Actinomycetota bacterium]
MQTFGHDLGLTARSVSTVEVGGVVARRSLLTRTLATDPDDLWDALTSPERIPRWFLPVSGDLRVGGRYQLEGNAGGEIEACEPPRLLRVTWVMGDSTTWLTVTLRPSGAVPEETTLEMEHVGPVPDEMWTRFGPSATGIGWDMTLSGLARHLRTGEDNDPTEFTAWSTSAGGTGFVQVSGEHWRAADLEAGTAPAEAAARVRRAVAFYTGQPDPPQA